MSGGRQELIKQATEALRLQDILLHQSSLARPSPFPDQSEASAEQQSRVSVRLERLDPDSAGSEAPSLMQCSVHLGTRLVATDDEKTEVDAPVYVEIQAEYRLTYEITVEDLGEEAMTAFAEFNIIHNVWPFWRQHVFDLVQRGGLPKLEVPLFAGIKL